MIHLIKRSTVALSYLRVVLVNVNRKASLTEDVIRRTIPCALENFHCIPKHRKCCRVARAFPLFSDGIIVLENLKGRGCRGSNSDLCNNRKGCSIPNALSFHSL